MAQRVRKNVSPALNKGGPLKATQQFNLAVRQGSPASLVYSSRPASRRSPVQLQSPTALLSAYHEGSRSKHSTSKVERPRPMRASPAASSTIRRTLSLETITGPYLNSQWPAHTVPAAPSPPVQDKGTQTDGDVPSKGKHKRSASVGHGDASVKEQFKRTQRNNKAAVKTSATSSRLSPVPCLKPVHQASRAINIPSVSNITRFTGPLRVRGSVEGLNAELEKLELESSMEGDHIEQVLCGDGRHPPCPDSGPRRGSSTRSTDTQTPRLPDSTGSSPSPLLLLHRAGSSPRPETLDKGTMCEDEESGRREEEGKGEGKVSDSPRPNKSYTFGRLPPDGCEKVTPAYDGAEIDHQSSLPVTPVISEEARRPPPLMKEPLMAPLRNFVLKPSEKSAFCALKGKSPLGPFPATSQVAQQQELQ